MEWTKLMAGQVFMTDLGAQPPSDADRPDVGRYAVWSPMANSDRHQIVEVGTDLNYLQKKYGVPDDRLCVLM